MTGYQTAGIPRPPQLESVPGYTSLRVGEAKPPIVNLVIKCWLTAFGFPLVLAPRDSYRRLVVWARLAEPIPAKHEQRPLCRTAQEARLGRRYFFHFHWPRYRGGRVVQVAADLFARALLARVRRVFIQAIGIVEGHPRHGVAVLHADPGVNCHVVVAIAAGKG